MVDHIIIKIIKKPRSGNSKISSTIKLQMKVENVKTNLHYAITKNRNEGKSELQVLKRRVASEEIAIGTESLSED